MNELTKSFFTSDKGIRNALLSAESWQENDHFNGVNIMSDDHELGFALFDEFSNVVETELKDSGLIFLLSLGSSAGFGFSLLLKSSLLFFFSFWAVLSK